MPVEIKFQDSLDVEICDETFAGVMQAFNLSIAKGNSFISLEDMEGGHVMINIPNILTVKELSE